MDIEQLRAAVDGAGPREPGRRFSPELRQQLIAATHRLWASGEALADIADALGIHVQTATRYLDVPVEDEGADHEPVVELPGRGLVPMEIPLGELVGGGLRITTPDGFVVDGLGEGSVRGRGGWGRGIRPR